jgi:hypothetical protein
MHSYFTGAKLDGQTAGNSIYARFRPSTAPSVVGCAATSAAPASSLGGLELSELTATVESGLKTKN